MIKYGDETFTDLKFAGFTARIEEQPQWMNIYLDLKFPPGTALPDDLSDPSALVICAYDGKIIEYVVLDEGCDSEYRFTDAEKQQIAAFVGTLLAEMPVRQPAAD